MRRPVHVTRFSPKETTQLLSCSDDTTVKLWDIPSQSSVTTFTDHTDYVRSGVMSNINPSLILTGSYDSTLRLFDARTGAAEMVMGSAEKGQAPVEDVLLFPSDTLALSSSGPILRVWDLVAGGRCLRALSNHQKTITCMTFNGNASRLLTGGLDQMVKVYDVSSYRVVHTMRYSAPLLCLAMSVSVREPPQQTERVAEVHPLCSPMIPISPRVWRTAHFRSEDATLRKKKPRQLQPGRKWLGREISRACWKRSGSLNTCPSDQ